MPTVGILGAGQLGRMLALAGYPLGLRFKFLDPAAEAPAEQLAERVSGPYEDLESMEQFARGIDLVTYEFENVPVDSAHFLEQRLPVYPPPMALEVAQDRVTEKEFFRKAGVATAPFAPVDQRKDLDEAVKKIGLPAVLKTRRFGYDGKGQMVVEEGDDLARAWEKLGGARLILEGMVPFLREVSILSCRSRNGEMVCYPLVENHHREGMLRLSLAPAPGLTKELQRQAEEIARRVAEALSYVGILAIELFEVGKPSRSKESRLIANEMAPRVHNSGHWTIEGAATSQFENHLRAILGWPLGSTAVQGAVAMVNLIGSMPDARKVLALENAHLHDYSKAPRTGRKLGHLTICADDAKARDAQLLRAQEILGMASHL